MLRLVIWYGDLLALALGFKMNVRAMTTPLAGCSVERGVGVGITWRHRREEGASGGGHPRLVRLVLVSASLA